MYRTKEKSVIEVGAQTKSIRQICRVYNMFKTQILLI